MLSNKLRALGAHVIELPTIRIEPPTNLREFAELVQDAHVYDWILFTSTNESKPSSIFSSSFTMTPVRLAARVSLLSDRRRRNA